MNDADLPGLNDCGCCEGVTAQTPAPVANRPGLSAITYRVGTHEQFNQSLRAALSDVNRPALLSLTTRDGDDFTLALLDAWATVADVLTFYQERIANESYLRTATEQRSLRELARLIDYEPRPGVAASTYLAFTLEDAAGAPGHATIEVGTSVQSLPGPGEKPQTFETVEKLAARAEWNALRPKQTQLRWPQIGDEHVYLRGVTTNLKPGDVLLFVGRTRESTKGAGTDTWQLRRVTTVEREPPADRTLVRWQEPLGKELPAAEQARVYALRLRAALFGHNALPWHALPIGLRIGERNPDPAGNPLVIPGIYVDRQNDWVEKKFAKGTQIIHLDVVYNQVTASGWLVLAGPPASDRFGPLELFRIEDVGEENRADYNLTARTMRLHIRGGDIMKFSPRETTVFAQSEELPLAETPLTEPVQQKHIVLDRVVSGLEPQRRLLVRGKRARVRIDTRTGLELLASNGTPKTLVQGDVLVVLGPPEEMASGLRWHLRDSTGLEGVVTTSAGQVTFIPAIEADERVSELAILDRTVQQDEEPTRLELMKSLQNVFDRPTVTIAANVTRATHGQSVTEVLGSGDAGQPYQRFTLLEAPLTYTSSDDPRGGDSTLEVRVNDLKWEEVSTLYGHGARERIYVTRRDKDGKTTVQFGDGCTGARPSTGRENIWAAYRKGLGREGLVKADQLTLLMTRPLGVKGVTNPLPAGGAQEPQALVDARRNAPFTVRTLDRVVSLRDYEDFAQAYSGIARAHVAWTWTGHGRGVFLSVAGPEGDPVPDDPVGFTLISALRKAGDPRWPVRVASYRKALFRLAAEVTRDPAHRAERVLADVTAALRTRFGFEAREFGQLVTLSEVIAVIQDVPGVTAVIVTALYRGGQAQERRTYLPAEVPRDGDADASVQAAELLTLDPAPLDNLEVVP